MSSNYCIRQVVGVFSCFGLDNSKCNSNVIDISRPMAAFEGRTLFFRRRGSGGHQGTGDRQRNYFLPGLAGLATQLGSFIDAFNRVGHLA